MVLSIFTPFRIEDAQSNGSNPVISAPERGILNEKWCKNATVLNALTIYYFIRNNIKALYIV